MITKELKKILAQLETIEYQAKREYFVYKAELKDRLDKHLTGDEAIKHYNEWMIATGMNHLIIK